MNRRASRKDVGTAEVEVQHEVAEMRIAYDAAEALLDRTCADWSAGVDHADWPVRIVATRSRKLGSCLNRRWLSQTAAAASQ